MSLLGVQRKVIPKVSTAVFKASFKKFSFWPWKGVISLKISKIIIFLLNIPINERIFQSWCSTIIQDFL